MPPGAYCRLCANYRRMLRHEMRGTIWSLQCHECALVRSMSDVRLKRWQLVTCCHADSFRAHKTSSDLSQSIFRLHFLTRQCAKFHTTQILDTCVFAHPKFSILNQTIDLFTVRLATKRFYIYGNFSRFTNLLLLGNKLLRTKCMENMFHLINFVQMQAELMGIFFNLEVTFL